MSLSLPTASSSNLQAIFGTAIKLYQRKTKKDLFAHPLMAELQTCNSPSDILTVLHAQLSESARGDEKLTKWLNPIVDVLFAFSATLSEGIGLVFPPANAIFAGVGILLSSTKDVESQEGLSDIFDCIEYFFRRLESYIAAPMTEAMKDIVVKIMAEVIEILGLVTKEVKRGRAKKYFRRLMGRRDIKEALRRLDRLTQEEARMLSVQVLQVTRDVGTRAETVRNQVAHVNDEASEDEEAAKATATATKAQAQQTAEDRPYPRPIRPQVFFGRNGEVKTIIDLIFSSASPARIAILGPGGVGKTALALTVFTHEQVVSRFGDSRYLVPCESLMSRDALLAAIANTLSLLQRGTTFSGYSLGLESHVLSALGSEECILCLDSFESPWDQPGPSRRAVEVLLADITAQSSVTVLITMRGVERPKGTAWTLPMLHPLTNFPPDAAMRTWESLAGTCDEWAEKLIDAVDCLPLAVALLGSLAEVSTAETLWERWQKENIALVEREKGDKLASLEFSISLSFESNRMAADGSSKRLLGILSLLPDGMPAFASPEFRRLFPDIPDISRSLDTLVKCSLAIRTADKRVQVNSLIRLYCERNDIIALEDRRALASHGYDYPSHELSEITSLLNSQQFSMSPSRTSPSSPPTTSSGRLRSFGTRELSPLRGADANAIHPAFFVTPASMQLTTGAGAHLLAPSLGGSTSPAINAPALFPFGSRVPSRSPSPARFPKHGSGLESDSDSVITQAERYIHTRSRAMEAISGFVDTAASIGHEALSTGVDLLQFAPVPGLQLAGNILLNIWGAVGMVKTNRGASLRLTERCEEILISIRDEIAHTGDIVTEELREPIAKLVKAFRGVKDLLTKLGQRPFLKRYLGRDEIQSSISACNIDLSDALGMFCLSIKIRTLNLIQANELRRQKETHDILESLSHLSPCLPPVHPPLSPAALQSSPTDPVTVHQTLHTLCSAQNSQDRARDSANLRQLMRTALDANDDLAMFEVFQIARSDMPEAIKTLERALERVVEGGQLDTEESTPALPSPQQEEEGKGNDPSVELGEKSPGQCSVDTLDREFIESGIDALRRLSKCTDLSLPSWTITQYEIELEEKVGVGFFSYVYRGTWRKHTVAIKELAETTPRKIFLREVEIWKSLHHPNVLELFGASSTSGEPPWFLVSKYYPRGSLVKYLKGLSDADTASLDTFKMIHEISEGMAYLHEQGVLHGDLKAANILVNDDTCCVISDFGQSEMKSEVYRITHASQPRGTLRWQAPELMQGIQTLTLEIDVYAFAICCGEILTMGALPWPLMDDDTVRHLVLNENMRPLLPPPSNLVDVQLMDIICASWDRVPSKRPSFEQVAREVKKLRAVRSAQNINLQMFDTQKPIPPVAGWDAQNAHHLPLPTSQSSRGQPDNVAPQHPYTIHGKDPHSTRRAPDASRSPISPTSANGPDQEKEDNIFRYQTSTMSTSSHLQSTPAFVPPDPSNEATQSQGDFSAPATSAMLPLMSEQTASELILGPRLRGLLNTCLPGSSLLTEEQRTSRLHECLTSLWYCLKTFNLSENLKMPLAPYVRAVFASPEVIRWIRTERDFASRLLGRCFGSLVVKKLASDIASAARTPPVAELACIADILGATGEQVWGWLDHKGAIDLANVTLLASAELETLIDSGTRGVPADVVDVFQQTLRILGEGMFSSEAKVEWDPSQAAQFHKIYSKLTNARVPKVLKEHLWYISKRLPQTLYVEEP